MANSDWARETPQKEEIKWFYFQPVLGQWFEPDWVFSLDGIVWHDLVVSRVPAIIGHLGLFWRKPYTSKGN